MLDVCEWEGVTGMIRSGGPAEHIEQDARIGSFEYDPSEGQEPLMAPPERPRYALSPWSAEFIDPAVEQAYRSHAEDRSARHLRLALLVIAGFVLVFSFSDYLDLGLSAQFFALAMARGIVAMAAITVFLMLARRPELSRSGYAATLVECVGFTAMIVVVAARPESNMTHAVGAVLGTFAIYQFIPNRVPLIVLAGAYFAIGFLLAMGVYNPLGSAPLTRLGLMLLLVNAVGYVAALGIGSLRREQFALLVEERMANQRLQTEVAQRRRLEQQLKLLATTDSLTGLCTRRHFLELANRELQSAKRSGKPMTLCMLDLDHFKRVNDEHGHLVGDAALVAVAEACRGALRTVDVIGRFGGEEFTILLPGGGPECARTVAERLRRCIKELEIAAPKGVLRLTATIGLAQCALDDDDVERALSQADEALYQGKREGRDCVVAVPVASSVD